MRLGICEVVSLAAAKLLEASVSTTDVQRSIAAQLLTMPDALAQNRLSEWDARTRVAMVDAEDGTHVGELLCAIFDLAQHNAFAAFDPDGSRAEYGRLRERLATAGIDLPESLEIETW